MLFKLAGLNISFRTRVKPPLSWNSCISWSRLS